MSSPEDVAPWSEQWSEPRSARVSARVLGAVTWVRRPDGVASGQAPWAGGVLNACYNALDRHVVHGRADQLALELPAVGGGLTYAELLDRVGRFGGVLRACGVGPGDVVLVALPAGPEAVVALLACARIGAVHAVLAPTTSAAEVRGWSQRWEPTVAVLVDGDPVAAVGEPGGHQPAVCVVLGAGRAAADLGERQVDWSTAMRENAVPPAGCVPLPAAHPLYVGPDQRLHPTGNVAALAVAGQHHAGVRAGEPWTPEPSVDWSRGHVWQVYPPLLAGATARLPADEAVAPAPGRPAWLHVVEGGTHTP